MEGKPERVYVVCFCWPLSWVHLFSHCFFWGIKISHSANMHQILFNITYIPQKFCVVCKHYIYTYVCISRDITEKGYDLTLIWAVKNGDCFVSFIKENWLFARAGSYLLVAGTHAMVLVFIMTVKVNDKESKCSRYKSMNKKARLYTGGTFSVSCIDQIVYHINKLKWFASKFYLEVSL